MKTHTKRDILMTIALPYANGQVHLGHLVEAIQADIWARFQRMQGNRCIFLCGTDAHGTPIMISAQKQGITSEEMVAQAHQNFKDDFASFLISFDNYYTTHSEENRELSNLFYERLKTNGDITTEIITQAYDPKENIFLSDRFIKGECPRCHTADQYGDSCEACGATYAPIELKNPISVLSGATPIEKESEHYFFHLEHYRDLLQAWMSEEHLQPQIINKLQEWFIDGLRQWDISRDAPYFGFEIPGAPGKYFYVWLDAPIGYMASLKNLCDQRGDLSFDHYFNVNSSTELYHFIGKDVVYFHALFWPAMLAGAKFRMPTAIVVHGFLTVNGAKMSKSRGTFITGKKYIEHLNPEYLRYYYAAKLNAQVEDIDLNLQDFMLRVNSDLVGKYVNLASRCAGFINKKFDNLLSDKLHDESLFQEFVSASTGIIQAYEERNFNRAVRDIMALADRANQYIDLHKPWSLAKIEGQEEQVQLICTQGLNLFKLLTAYLKPILPITAEKVEAFLNMDPLDFSNFAVPLLSHTINTFNPLMQRVTPEELAQLKNTNDTAPLNEK